MANQQTHDMTQLLSAAGGGDSDAAAELLPLVYAELRRLASAYLGRSPPGQTLQPTALVHEAYLRLVGNIDPGWHGRGHFFGAAAQAMRQILVDRARAKASLKRGGGMRRVAPANLQAPLDAPAEDLLALDEVLTRLEQEDPRKHQIVMLRFFAGLTAEQTAEVTGASLRTVERDWQFARAWLRAELTRE